MLHTVAIASVLASVLAVAACDVPQDPDGTLDRVSGGTMRVGVTDADPWVELEGGEPIGGVEVELVRRFARDVGARLEWVDGSEEELVNALKEGSLDLVVGGLTSKSRWKKDAAFTRPYATTSALLAAQPGSTLDPKLKGARVSVERGSEEEALADKKTDALVVPVESLEGAEAPVAAHDYVLDDLGLQPIGKQLKQEKHVMAVALGENAFLVRLERFLLEREKPIQQLLIREGRP